MSLSVISTPARPPQVLIHWVHSVKRSGDRIHSHISLWPATCDLRIRPKKKSWYRIFPDLPAAQPSKPFVYSFKEISVLKMLPPTPKLSLRPGSALGKKGGKNRGANRAESESLLPFPPPRSLVPGYQSFDRHDYQLWQICPQLDPFIAANLFNSFYLFLYAQAHVAIVNYFLTT